MKIKRTINGVNYTIELLPDELEDAFFEQRDKFDIEDIISYAETFSNEELIEFVGCDYGTIIEHKEEMAERMRKYMDKYDMEFSYAREEAIRDIASENKEIITA